MIHNLITFVCQKTDILACSRPLFFPIFSYIDEAMNEKIKTFKMAIEFFQQLSIRNDFHIYERRIYKNI